MEVSIILIIILIIVNINNISIVDVVLIVGNYECKVIALNQEVYRTYYG
jgi:hypothetical protein